MVEKRNAAQSRNEVSVSPSGRISVDLNSPSSSPDKLHELSSGVRPESFQQRRNRKSCSRSLGDTKYYGPNRSGVIPEPEVTSHRLDARDKLIVLGSDGVWDRVSSQEAVEIAAGCRDAESASERIAQVARERWRQHGPMADDVTCVVAFFDR